jgi:hypothetical protein
MWHQKGVQHATQNENYRKKAVRRGNNEGSIYQRKDGRWCAQVTIGYKGNGKAIFKYAYGATRQEVAKKLTQYTHEVFENGYSSFASSDTKMFYPLLEDWFFTFKEPVISSQTSEKLRNFVQRFSRSWKASRFFAQS